MKGTKPHAAQGSAPPANGRLCHCRRSCRGKTRDEPSDNSKAVGKLLLCRLRPLLFLSALFCYAFGLLRCASIFSFRMPAPAGPPPPGSVYRSKELFDRLLPHMLSDDSSSLQLDNIWTSRRKLKQLKHCTNKKPEYSGSTGLSGYLIVDANGGLNQQRSSICNAVALAGFLNATLVVPKFHLHNIWMDRSEFRDIYDEDHFISTVERHVTLVRELPEVVMERFDYNISKIPNLKVKAWASASYYTDVALPLLREYGVIRISPFANRLENEVPSEMQRLRCLANYKALKFSPPIATMAKKLINRMVRKSASSGGKYVAVHLRFEEDMVAFSCCVYDGGMGEKVEMDFARQRGWKKFKQQSHCLRPDLNRMHGKCPLTPLEDRWG